MRDPALTSVDPMGFNPISKWTGHRFSRQSSPPHTPVLQIGKLGGQGLFSNIENQNTKTRILENFFIDYIIKSNFVRIVNAL